MDKEWSELFKKTQFEIKKKDSFDEGIISLLTLRDKLMATLLAFKNDLSKDEFCAIPFINANGYHNKTILYSIWHIFRIEDIVTHTLIVGDEQVFFKEDYQRRINSPIITTGNELEKEEISDFSKKLDVNELFAYAMEVKESTESIIGNIAFADAKKTFFDNKKQRLLSLNVVSEKASWLIDYWCGKNTIGLILMPLSRHWIMHIEACLRILSKIQQKK